MKIICQVYRSPRKEEMYLYVEKEKGLEDVPEPLLARFGEPEPVMVVLLSPDKKLARANVTEVIEKITEEGFYLQMPPTHAQLLHRDGNEH
jgi:uncharacterized protein